MQMPWDKIKEEAECKRYHNLTYSGNPLFNPYKEKLTGGGNIN